MSLGEQPRTRYLLPDEEERLMAVMIGYRAHLRQIVVLAINTGMRRGELLRLQWVHIDFHKNEIKVVQTKTDRDRFVPMNARVREELQRLRAEAAGEFVFWNRKTGRNIADVKTAFKSACRAAGLVDLHFHDLRRTFARMANRAGISYRTIMEIAGWKSEAMLLRYLGDTKPSEQRAAFERLAISTS